MRLHLQIWTTVLEVAGHDVVAVVSCLGDCGAQAGFGDGLREALDDLDNKVPLAAEYHIQPGGPPDHVLQHYTVDLLEQDAGTWLVNHLKEA